MEIRQEDNELVSRLKEILQTDLNNVPSLRTIDSAKVKAETKKINEILKNVRCKNIDNIREVIKAAAILVSERVGVKRKTEQKQKDPFWKRRIENDIGKLRKDLSRIEAWFKGNWKNGKQQEKLDLKKKYSLRAKGFKTVMEELKQRISAKKEKLKRFVARTTQYRQNRLFRNNQKVLYEELGGKRKGGQEAPDAEASTEFWSNLWDNPVQHNESAEWLKQVEQEMKRVKKDSNISITKEDVSSKIRKMPNWKSPGLDGIQGYWLKRFTSLHEMLAKELNQCLVTGKVPAWMVEGRTVLIQKDPNKGNAVGNYRPIACLNLLRKLLTAIISDKLYLHLETQDLLPEEQKGCRKGSRGTKDQLLIDKAVIRNCKRRKSNLNMAWIDFRKAFDMVPHSWMLKSLDLIGAPRNVIELLKNSMKDWKTNLFSGESPLGAVNINRGIFQGDSLSPLLFVITLIPLTLVLRRLKQGYSFGKGKPRLNHLLFMDDLKLYGNSESDVDSLVRTTKVVTEDIGMSFGIDKCGVLALKGGKNADAKE